MTTTKFLDKSRFISYTDGKKDKHIFKTLSGKRVKRTLLERRDLSIFGMAKIYWKGKKIDVLLDSILID